MAFIQQTTMPADPTTPFTSTAPVTPATPVTANSSFFSRRSARQLGLFFAGAGFVGLSSIITRRSLVRRYKATMPKFYQQSNRPHEVNGAVEAFEALNIATINVISVGMMLTGGALWALDISSVEDMRREVRGGIGVDAGGRTDKEAEEEIEEWLASVFARKDMKDLVKLSKEAREKKEEKEEKS